MNAFMKTLAVLLPVVVLWGCSTTGTKDNVDGENGGTPTSAVKMPADANGGTGVTVGGYQGSELDGGTKMDTQTQSLLAKRVVYFDFDRSEIKPEARRIIEAHAKKLANDPNARVVMEGHCDERGTREYNLSLGERRAKAVQRVMNLMGVSSNQVELVSYGEERPAKMGHDEGAWSLNRRVEFIYN